MKRRKKIADFKDSEPDFLISYLDRHDEWAVIICLVGGGQEIHDGEAGIAEWLEAVRIGFPEWQVYVSSGLTDSEYAAESALDSLERGRSSHPRLAPPSRQPRCGRSARRRSRRS